MYSIYQLHLKHSLRFLAYTALIYVIIIVIQNVIFVLFLHNYVSIMYNKLAILLELSIQDKNSTFQ